MHFYLKIIRSDFLIEDDDMEYIIKNSATLEEAGDKLIESANRNGGDDNITAVLAKIE